MQINNYNECLVFIHILDFSLNIVIANFVQLDIS